jgi:hypothetical protein
MVSKREALRLHGERLRNLMQDLLEVHGPTKFIVTKGDHRVCTKCLQAEADGIIPYDQPYSNSMMHPSFHGHTCRCREISSGELSQGVNVKAQENNVDVGFFEKFTAEAAQVREYGSGISPPRPDIRHALDTIDPAFFEPFYGDLTEHFKKRFLGK